MNEPNRNDLDSLIKTINHRLPDSTEWTAPEGYPHSLALCVLDSIWSISVNYDRHVIPVLDRYRAHRRAQGGDPYLDGPTDLLAVIDSYPEVDDFCDEIASHHRTSSTNGILKAEAVHRACTLIIKANVNDTVDFRDRYHDVKAGWHRIPGQRSGISWRYVLMLADVEGVKADRMIGRFVAGAVEAKPTPAEAEHLMLLAADHLGVSARELDHEAWKYQRSVSK